MQREATAFINFQACRNGVRRDIERYATGAISSAIGNLGMLWLGWLDSNQRSRDQNPLPCRLATPQQSGTYILEEDKQNEKI